MSMWTFPLRVIGRGRISYPGPCPGYLRLLGCDGCPDLRTDDLAGDRQFDAAILLAALRRVVGRNRLGLPQTLGRDRSSGHARLRQVVAHAPPRCSESR